MTPAPDTDRTTPQGDGLREALDAQISWTRKYGHLTLHQLTDRLEAAEAERDLLRTRAGELEKELEILGRDPKGSEPLPTAEPKVSAASAAAVSRADRPSPGLLMSMAMRYDHAIGHAGFYDRKPAGIGKPGSDPGGHARRLSGTMNSMRQLWEEATGCGFYAPHKEADYRALAETCGVAFLDSGFAVSARANDERALRENAQRSSPKDASVIDEVEAPDLHPLQGPDHAER